MNRPATGFSKKYAASKLSNNTQKNAAFADMQSVIATKAQEAGFLVTTLGNAKIITPNKSYVFAADRVKMYVEPQPTWNSLFTGITSKADGVPLSYFADNQSNTPCNDTMSFIELTNSVSSDAYLYCGFNNYEGWGWWFVVSTSYSNGTNTASNYIRGGGFFGSFVRAEKDTCTTDICRQFHVDGLFVNIPWARADSDGSVIFTGLSKYASSLFSPCYQNSSVIFNASHGIGGKSLGDCYLSNKIYFNSVSVKKIPRLLIGAGGDYANNWQHGSLYSNSYFIISQNGIVNGYQAPVLALPCPVGGLTALPDF